MIIPTENEDHKPDLETSLERGRLQENFNSHVMSSNGDVSTNNNLTFIGTTEPNDIQCDLAGFHLEIPENNDKLIFTKLPTHPTLVFVNTKL